MQGFNMKAIDILRQRVRQSALELDLLILDKAAQLRDAALRGQTTDNPRALKIALFLAGAAASAGRQVDLET
jgi:hypothetical protein